MFYVYLLFTNNGQTGTNSQKLQSSFNILEMKKQETSQHTYNINEGKT